ncbi:jg10977 [Pararge aegeria aegeria]|uniref:Jg10977 protein n=1 Tax=Pararge aegeria aegeria TaxID=348720 RepID=A0A8S4SBU0_9NEOP|nr:jg10977 [Pararge aegeria aegeria]
MSCQLLLSNYTYCIKTESCELVGKFCKSGTGENGSWKGIPDPSGADEMRSASYASAVYRRRDADPYGTSRFDGKKAKGELDQTVLEHTLRNISYRIPKGRQPCDDVV